MQCECPERAPIPCDTSDLHAPCCAAQQLACVPGPKPRRETRDANAEEATGEKQLLRLERPFQTAGPTYNVIQNARGFLTKQVMRCRARLTAPLGRAQPPLSTTPYYKGRKDPLSSSWTRPALIIMDTLIIMEHAQHDPLSSVHQDNDQNKYNHQNKYRRHQVPPSKGDTKCHQST